VASDAEKLYKQSLARYISSVPQDFYGGSETDCQETWMKIVMLIHRTTTISSVVIEGRQGQISAARKIRIAWRNYNLRRLVHIIAFIRIKSSIGWRLRMWVRITRKKNALTKIKFLVSEVRWSLCPHACVGLYRRVPG
jgi:hypothetical protein